MISQQKIEISEAIPVPKFQNIWKSILGVSTVSLKLFSFCYGDIWHIFKICYLLFCSIYSRLSCSLVIFLVPGILYFSLYDFGRISLALQFLGFFSSVLTARSIKSKCTFLSLKSVILEGGWKLDDKTLVSTSSAGVMRERAVRSMPVSTSGWSMIPAPRQRSTLRPITCVIVLLEVPRAKVCHGSYHYLLTLT